MLGRDGTTNEIDVLYSYEHLGLKYRVAIECKNWKRSVNVEELRNFYYKLKSIGNINGIFISAQSGYQQGARRVSEYNGIRIVKYNDFNSFISGKFEEYLSPDFDIIGDPFWMLVNHLGENTIEQDLIDGDTIFLFQSKKVLEKYRNLYFDKDNIKIIGVSQAHLKEIAGLEKEGRVQVKLLIPPEFRPMNPKFNFVSVNNSILQMYIR